MSLILKDEGTGNRKVKRKSIRGPTVNKQQSQNLKLGNCSGICAFECYAVLCYITLYYNAGGSFIQQYYYCCKAVLNMHD